MGTFERLSVLVIGVILVMILVVAAVTWTDDPAVCQARQEQHPVVPGPIEPAPATDPEVWADPPPVPAPAPAQDPAPEPAPPAPALPPVEPAPSEPLREIVHVVTTGETLTQIAQKYYPSTKYYPEIMRANGLETPLIREGQKLVIPPVAALGLENEEGKLDKQPLLPPPAARPVPGQPYTVRQGEDLPGIAKRAYDNVERWPDIWIANRDQVPDPKAALKEGLVLQLPD